MSEAIVPGCRRTASALAFNGAGVGYRGEISDELDSRTDAFDVLEILSDAWMTRMHLLREVCGRHRTAPHGVGLSVAGGGRPGAGYLGRVKQVIELTGADYYSEHLTATHVPGLNSGHLCPPLLTAESLERCIDNVRYVQEFLEVPLALENISYTVGMSADPMDGADFLAEVVERADALLLLDVANLYINSRNHSFDALDYLRRLPLDKVAHIHLAGGIVTSTGKFVDTHSEIISKEIWNLAEEVAARCSPRTVIIEHDQNFPDFDKLIAESDQARSIFFESGASSHAR